MERDGSIWGANWLSSKRHLTFIKKVLCGTRLHGTLLDAIMAPIHLAPCWIPIFQYWFDGPYIYCSSLEVICNSINVCFVWHYYNPQ